MLNIKSPFLIVSYFLCLSRAVAITYILWALGEGEVTKV